MHRALFEACVDTLDDAVAAGLVAERLELCIDLAADGCTPPVSLVEECVTRVEVPVVVMIRPRGGDFVYDNTEIGAMRADMAALRVAGARGFATGALTPDGEIDIPSMQRLLEAAGELPVTFHKAFDATPRHEAALDVLRTLGVARVLTSGGAATALDGLTMLRRLVKLGADDIEVIAAGSIRKHNVKQILIETGARAFHAKWGGWVRG